MMTSSSSSYTAEKQKFLYGLKACAVGVAFEMEIYATRYKIQAWPICVICGSLPSRKIPGQTTLIEFKDRRAWKSGKARNSVELNFAQFY